MSDVEVRVEQVAGEGSMATLVGRRLDTGERVAAYADGRMARDIAEQVAAATVTDELPVALVPGWALAGR